MNIKKLPLVIVGASLLLIGISIWCVYSLHDEAKTVFGDTGTVGDTIGGIAGPILNLAGMIIVYFSLLEQFRANNDQNEAIRVEIKRSNDEVVLKSTQQVIEAASQELGIQKHNLDSLLEKVASFDEDLDRRRILDHVDATSELKDKLQKLDAELVVAASILTLAYNRIVVNSFPQEYRTYTFYLFKRICFEGVPNIIIWGRSTKMNNDWIPNFMRIQRILIATRLIQDEIYSEAFALGIPIQ
ncbi:hypothetical protein [Hymenobacter metallicola]|uniref:Uncharacterized protein n=1 Tax=Hymenobacter metallicola TaxID=2563114 RepID=A0A4Z0QCL4_9BACT|nr:hypothetical protein [Hymenobacter metallicola]TGE26893.1 hypothetical protein E5K02_10825 [Hymenobacter metallicola]